MVFSVSEGSKVMVSGYDMMRLVPVTFTTTSICILKKSQFKLTVCRIVGHLRHSLSLLVQK